jgi:hypothetical protein
MFGGRSCGGSSRLEEDRAAIAGDLYQFAGAGSIAELLIDLEQDRRTALIVADVLKGSVLLTTARLRRTSLFNERQRTKGGPL